MGRRWTHEQLCDVYDATRGRCHVCGRKVYFTNHGKRLRRGAWHVDHVVPRVRGGTNQRDNLRAACVPCNLAKGARTVDAVRSHCRRPRTTGHVAELARLRWDRIVHGALLGALIGLMLGNGATAVWLGIVSAWMARATFKA